MEKLDLNGATQMNQKGTVFTQVNFADLVGFSTVTSSSGAVFARLTEAMISDLPLKKLTFTHNFWIHRTVSPLFPSNNLFCFN